MKSLWTTPLSSHFMWEFQLVLTLFFLCVVPSVEPIFYAMSTAVALGAVLVLFLFKKTPRILLNGLAGSGGFFFCTSLFLAFGPWSRRKVFSP